MQVKTIATKKSLSEALELSATILENIELNNLSLENIALKVARLARLLNDFEMQSIIKYEVGGYPLNYDKLPADIYRLAVIAGREFQNNNDKERYIFPASIRVLEDRLKTNELALAAAQDPNISISSANPSQFVWAPQGNAMEREKVVSDTALISSRLSSRRSFIYHYVLKKHYELKFSGISEDIFSQIRKEVDDYIGTLLPTSIKKFDAIYDNLISDNSEDWSNAVHGCRRILQDLADVVFPPTDKNRIREGKAIKLGNDNYINRIIAFVEDSTDSKRFAHLVGSHIEFIGERLDSIFKAAQKGSHSDILDRKEANRYVVYTYMIVGDILTLWKEKNSQG